MFKIIMLEFFVVVQVTPEWICYLKMRLVPFYRCLFFVSEHMFRFLYETSSSGKILGENIQPKLLELIIRWLYFDWSVVLSRSYQIYPMYFEVLINLNVFGLLVKSDCQPKGRANKVSSEPAG